MKNKLFFLLIFFSKAFCYGQETSIYCEYCFKLLNDQWTKKVYATNVFITPSRYDYRNQDFACFLTRQEAEDALATMLSGYIYTDSPWQINYENIEGGCSPYQEKALEDQEKEEKENRKRQEELSIKLAEREQILNKENQIKYFQSLDNKPLTIPDGWHEVLIIYGDNVINGRKALVSKNRIVKVASPYLHLFDGEQAVESPLIKEGKITVKENNSSFFDVYFIKYIENPNYETPAPIVDPRAYWWQATLDIQWKTILSMSAWAGERKISMNENLFSISDLDLLNKIDRIEIPAKDIPEILFRGSISQLINPYFENLSNIKVKIKNPGYTIIFNSIDEFQQNENKIKAWLKLDSREISLFTNKTLRNQGVFEGTQKIVINLNSMSISDLDRIDEANSLVFPNDFPFGSSGDNQITSELLLPKLKNIYLNGHETLDLFDLDYLKFGDNKNVNAIYACDTKLAKEWKKLGKKKREAYLKKMRKFFPWLQKFSLCMTK